MIHKSVAIKKTFLSEKPLLALQSDLDHIKRGHEERDSKGSSPAAHHLLLRSKVHLLAILAQRSPASQIS